MDVRKRKWNSMLHLPEEAVGVMIRGGHDPSGRLPQGTLRRASVVQLSVSNPDISRIVREEQEEEEVEGQVKVGKDDLMDGNTTSSPASPNMNNSGDFDFVPTPNKSRQKKFDRHFKLGGEEVVEYFSCALADDILLLQGFLYITRKHFAFYSNVFGRITKELIPVQSIQNIWKTKTAFIIPNAIALQTAARKYLFASFISRQVAFEKLFRVWSAVVPEAKGLVSPQGSPEALARRRTGTVVSPDRLGGKIKGRSESCAADSSSDSTNNQNEATGGPSKRVSFVDDPAQRGRVISEDPGVRSEIARSRESDANNSTPAEFPEAPRGSAPNLKLIRLCCVLTVLMAVSALHLYGRIEQLVAEIPGEGTFAHAQNSGSSSDDEAVRLLVEAGAAKAKLEEAEAAELEAAHALIARLNHNIQRMNLVQKALRDLSADFPSFEKRRIVQPSDGISD